MSERKTAEIKFRIEPSVKAFWQAQAADETEGNLSELIVKATNQHVYWARENARLDGTKLLGSALASLEAPQLAEALEEREHELSADCWCGPKVVANPEVPEGEVWVVDMEGVVDRRDVKVVQIVPLGPAAEMAQKFPAPRPWTFEGQNG